MYRISYLIRLNVILCNGLEFCRWDGGQETLRGHLLYAFKDFRRPYLRRIGRLKVTSAYAINLFKSVLLMAPMGLRSAGVKNDH